MTTRGNSKRVCPPVILALAACGGSLALVACGGGDGGAADATTSGAAWQEEFPSFTRHMVAEMPSGSQALVVDIDGDGRNDITAFSSSKLVWYKNPTWEEFNISSATERFINMAPYDVDGDGDVDLAMASEFSLGDSNNGGLVHWAEAPDDPTTNQEWTIRLIDAVPASHRIRWGDIDGDGRKELLVLPIIGVGVSGPEYIGASEFKSHSIPADPTGPWQTAVLDDSRLEVAHGIAVVDWDGDRADDILTASGVGVLLFRPALAAGVDYVLHVGAGKEGPRPQRGSSEVSLGTLGSDQGRFLATIEPWHGNEVVVYTPNDGGALPWSREVIENEFNGGHGLVAADLDGDGYDEIVAGYRGGDYGLFIYRYQPNSESWERIPLDVGGVSVSSLDVKDINGDGRLDILSIGSGTENVVWYENAGIQ